MTTQRRQPSVPVRKDRDRGSTTAELVVLFPIVVMLLLLVVALGRLAHGKQLVEQAALAAARAASLTSTPTAAVDQGQQAAQLTLTDAGLSCATFTVTVQTGRFGPGGEVTATATAPLEIFRQFTETAGRP